MEALGLTTAQLVSRGAGATAREIAQQPQVWPEVARLIAGDAALGSFLAPLLAEAGRRIVLTGAGSSSFIGRCLAPSLARAGRRAEAIATTDIVADPAGTLSPHTPTLMVHFARSGNSPESVGALELAVQRLERCAHLVVTCNRDGELYRRAAALRQPVHVLLLPEACNDQGFAMTSSVTGMLLAGALALGAVPSGEARISRLGGLAMQVMSTSLPLLTDLVRAQFERAVFLGSGELQGLAHEAALKMLELTDGRVVSVGDAPLAFRHGPKTILNGNALVVLFVSNDPYIRRYELDLLNELRREGVAGRVIALANAPGIAEDPDTVLLADEAGDPLSDLELSLPYAVFAQLLAMLRSLSLWLTPDSPNAAGTVNRVVQGVTLYTYGGAR